MTMLLLQIYLEAYLITKNPRYKNVARETLDYLQRIAIPLAVSTQQVTLIAKPPQGMMKRMLFTWTPLEIKEQ